MKYVRIRQLDCHNNGQGVIWEARTKPGDHKVALKYMKVDPSDTDPTTTERFLREIRCQSSLIHPNIVNVLGSGTSDERGPFYAMEWADGSLRDILQDNPNGVSDQAAVRIFTSIVEAMTYAHQEGVLHRDLKPENVLFFNGVPRLADFGLGRRLSSDSTRITQSHLGLGTMAYMAPEQFSNAHSVGPSADVFSLGKILFELTTGIFPNFLPNISKAPSKYQYILHRCLEQDSEKRFANAGQLAQALALVSGDTDLLSPPDERAKSALARVLAGDEAGMPELADILLSNPDDSNLYLQFLPLLPEQFVHSFGAKLPSEFAKVMINFDVFARGGHPFSFCDTLADFIAAAYKASTDLSTRKLLLENLLELGHSHNRWHVRDVFIDLAREAVKTPGYTQIVVDALENNWAGREFVKYALSQQSMPQAILDVLTDEAA
ncbi:MULTISPECIES: serine/threonine-protein kinase [Nocardiaceae]|uniref:serine/threonine-protein kinase n=1 Tax=Nocardiaceae TaxID=85025 RepID=UPI000567BA44|nr:MULTISPECIES: serine/threonine-protein kinase [Rhodococcus]MCZ4277382.1 serine/threonine-protein kinase [Rhodococcus yunnanensis]